MSQRRHLMQASKTHAAERLRDVVRGRVYDDQKTLQRFSIDQSIYEIKPLTVVLPEDVEDVLRLVEFAAREGLSVTPRGGGSGTAGSALGEGIVMALPDNEFWGGISRFSAGGDSARIRAGAGVYHNELQKFLRARGFFLPADVTSADISRIGGNIATKASGPHALRYGSIDRFLEQVEFITAGGERVDTGDETTIPERFKQGLSDLVQRLGSDKAARGFLEARRGLKTASGYNLFALLDDLSPGKRIAQLLTGSVGTLGLITRATLRAEVYEKDRTAVLLYFSELADAGLAAGVLRDLDVAAIELISRETINILRGQTALPDSLFPVLDAHMLFVELTGRDLPERVEKITGLFQGNGFRLSMKPVIVTSEEETGKLWELRKRILWLIGHPKPGLRALTVINDVGVPPARLAGFITDAQKVFDKHQVVAFIYGHAGDGNLHLRPLFDVTLPDLRGRVRRVADDVYEAVFRHGGTISAEHGMGRLRAPYLRREWGDTLYNYMREIKRLFDPHELLNPGVMFTDRPITDNMRRDLFIKSAQGG